MKLLSALVVVAHLSALGVLATKDYLLQGLPKCWQDCFSNTENGCASGTCICSTSGDSSSYLPSAVSCAVAKCDAQEWSLHLVLGPLQLYCAATDCAISDEVMKNAYAAAGPSPPSPPSPTQQTTKATGLTHGLTSTIRTTFTRTTTENGNTLQIVVPIELRPSSMVTGPASTSTITAAMTSNASPSSDVASSKPTPPSGPAQAASSASPTSSRAAQRPASGNGSPFDNMQAAASRSIVSTVLLGLGCVAIIFVRL